MGQWAWGLGTKKRNITNYQLPITNYQLPITNYQLPITNYQCPMPQSLITLVKKNAILSIYVLKPHE
ncbi:hypothetical protein PI95_013090 [Hassallia byssoidea VB512170]|uniref:Uncharacterized protein n=2 Tax=Hassallia TaxID=482629 RepID=A0A846H9X5_9CYAN|nr:hypothetical protein [Hassalia byssoidea VB512170]